MSLLLLDTTALIDAERDPAAVDEVIADDDDTAIAAVTVAGLQVGASLADGGRRTARQAYIDAVVAVVPVISMTWSVDGPRSSAHGHSHGRPTAWRTRRDHRGHGCRRWPRHLTADPIGFEDLERPSPGASPARRASAHMYRGQLIRPDRTACRCARCPSVWKSWRGCGARRCSVTSPLRRTYSAG